MITTTPRPIETKETSPRGTLAEVLPFVVAGLAGLASVIVLGLGVKRVVEVVLLEALGPTVTHHGILYAGISAPLSEEAVSAFLFWGATVVCFLAGHRWPRFRGYSFTQYLPLAGWLSLALGFTFALTETVANRDGGILLVLVRTLAHGSFAALSTIGFWAAVFRKNGSYAVIGLVAAMIAHGVFNTLGELDLVSMKFLWLGILIFLDIGLLRAQSKNLGLARWPPESWKSTNGE